jgi:hypothetical protein
MGSTRCLGLTRWTLHQPSERKLLFLWNKSYIRYSDSEWTMRDQMTVCHPRTKGKNAHEARERRIDPPARGIQFDV